MEALTLYRVALLMWPMALIIGLADYAIFARWSKCDRCGEEVAKWYTFILPTLLEFFCLVVGILIGLSVILR